MVPLFKVTLSSRAAKAVEEVLASGYLGQGPRVDEFEAALGSYWGRGDPVAVSSGTAALDLAYHLSSLGPGDRVLTSPLTCTATNLPLLHRGCDIEWYDCDPLTGCFAIEDVLRRADLPPIPAAIVLVSWAGRSLDAAVTALRQRLHHTIPIIVDYAHAAPLPPPLLADYTCYSFQAIKHLTTGDGGALVSAAPADTSRARLLRWYGLDRSSRADFRCSQDITDPGFKYQMNDIAAALGLANLEDLAGRRRRHWRNADTLWELVDSYAPYLEQPSIDIDGCYWVYPVSVKGGKGVREELIAHLAAHGIASGRVHRRNDEHSCFRDSRRSEILEGVTYFEDHQLCLPCAWWLPEGFLGHGGPLADAFRTFRGAL